MNISSQSIEDHILNKIYNNNTLFSVTIELTTKCNWRCKHCYIESNYNGNLNKNIIFDIFEELRNLGTFEIILTGGEIFCRNDILDIDRLY